MELPNLRRISYKPIAPAIVVALHTALSATAQTAGVSNLTGQIMPDGRRDPEQGQTRALDLTVVTHDVIGKSGVSIPLNIQLVRARQVEIESIKLLGLPSGAKITDSTNTLSPSSDTKDVDITSWDLNKLQITQGDARESNFLLAVAAFWQPVGGGRSEIASGRLRVKFVRDYADQKAFSAGGCTSTTVSAPNICKSSPSAQPASDVAEQHVSTSDVFVPEVQVAPLAHTGAIHRGEVVAAADVTFAMKAQSETLPQPAMTSQPPPIDPLVERARGLIRLGDISEARLLLEYAGARNAPNATFLLAQTWDPAMLKTWKVRGLRADPDLARRLYAKAAGQERSGERLLAATSR